MDTKNENCGLPYDQCYYPHRSRYSLSPLCVFFLDVNSVINFRIVTHFWLCLLETQVVGEVHVLFKFWLLALTVW